MTSSAGMMQNKFEIEVHAKWFTLPLDWNEGKLYSNWTGRNGVKAMLQAARCSCNLLTRMGELPGDPCSNVNELIASRYMSLGRCQGNKIAKKGISSGQNCAL